jgi:hypothetical protein
MHKYYMQQLYTQNATAGAAALDHNFFRKHYSDFLKKIIKSTPKKCSILKKIDAHAGIVADLDLQQQSAREPCRRASVITEDEEEEGQAKGLQGTMKGLFLRLQSGYVGSNSNLRGRDFRKRLLRDQPRLQYRLGNCFQTRFGKAASIRGSETA